MSPVSSRIKTNPFDLKDPGAGLLIDQARQIGANVAFPFAGGGKFEGAVQVLGQHAGLEDTAAGTTGRALNASSSPTADGTTNSGSMSVVAISGGAESFASVHADQPLQNAIYLIPGSGIFTELPKGSGENIVMRGGGFVEFLLGLFAQERGFEKIKVKCKHNIDCVLKEFQSVSEKRKINFGKPCDLPPVFGPAIM